MFSAPQRGHSSASSERASPQFRHSHEYAHALLHFDVDDDTERSKREVEAEAIAYVVGHYCGLDTSGSAFYLAAWKSDDPEVVREHLGRISRTVEEISEVLDDV